MFSSTSNHAIVLLCLPHQDVLMVSESASYVVGRRFAHRPVHTKDHHKNGTNFIPAWNVCIRLGVWQQFRPQFRPTIALRTESDAWREKWFGSAT